MGFWGFGVYLSNFSVVILKRPKVQNAHTYEIFEEIFGISIKKYAETEDQFENRPSGEGLKITIKI